jgi:hypothetical protein
LPSSLCARWEGRSRPNSVSVFDTQPFCPACPASFPKYVDWRDQNAVIEAIGGYSAGAAVLTGNGTPEERNATGEAVLRVRVA